VAKSWLLHVAVHGLAKLIATIKCTIIIIIININFTLAYYLLRGGLLVSPDLNKISEWFTPALYEWGLQCSLVLSSVALWSTSDLGATEGSRSRLIVPDALIMTGKIFVFTFHILLISIARSLYLLSFFSFCVNFWNYYYYYYWLNHTSEYICAAKPTPIQDW